MNLKALKEKRNALLSEADELVKVSETEVRSLTDEEQSTFTNLSASIKDIDKQIVEFEARQKDGKKIIFCRWQI